MHVLKRDLDVMAELKATTAAHHKGVERLMPFFEEHLSFDRYRETMIAFLGLYEPLEDQLSSLSGWHEVGINLAQRRRAYLLRTDLHALGMSESTVAALPRCDDLPKLNNCLDGLGCLYVLEGSTLGGQLIARELDTRLGIGERSGAAFFHSYGANVGSMWKEFCSAVRKYVDTPAKRDAVADAAHRTFSSFATWMGKELLDAR